MLEVEEKAVVVEERVEERGRVGVGVRVGVKISGDSVEERE